MKYFQDKNKKEDLKNLGAGFLAGATTSTILNPLDIYNNKVQTMQGLRGSQLSAAREGLKNYLHDISFRNGPKQAFKTYRAGLGSKALKVGLAGALTFATYGRYKNLLNKLDKKNDKKS